MPKRKSNPPSPRTNPAPPPDARGSVAVPDEGFARIGELLRRLALGLTAILIVTRPLWPSEDAATGTGLTWVAATLVVAGIAIIATLFGGVVRYRWSLVDGAFLLLVALVALSTFGLPTHAIGFSWPGAADRRSAINLAWEWGGLFVIYLLVRWLPRTRAESSTLAGIVVTTAGAIALYGMYQGFVELPSLQRMVERDPERAMRLLGVTPGSPGEAAMRSRILGSKEPFATFALANSLAGFLVGALAMGLAVAAENFKRAGRGSRVVAFALAAAPAVVLALCLLLTKSRSAWIGLAVAMVCIALRAWGQLSKRAIAIGAGLMLVGLIVAIGGLASIGQLDKEVLTQGTKSLKYRLEYWRGTWDIITNAPNPYEPKTASAIKVGEEEPIVWPESHAFWCGIGPGNFSGAYLRHKLPQASEEIVDPHNMVLEVWVSSGLPAVIALIAVLGGGVFLVLMPSRQTSVSDENVSEVESDRESERRGGTVWLMVFAWASWFVVAITGKLDPFDAKGDMLMRWAILGAGLFGISCLGTMLWRRREIPAFAAGVGVLALAINLLAAGGIGMPAVALVLWVLLALGLNLKDESACGRLRERVSLAFPAVGSLVWAAAVGSFVGAIGPFWLSETLRERAEVAMSKQPPIFEIARKGLLESIEADKANVRPILDLARLEFIYWHTPEARSRPEVRERVFLTLDSALKPHWRDPNSLMVRKLQAEYAKQIEGEIENPTALDLLTLKSRRVRACRHAARLYPTNVLLRVELALASAELNMYDVALDEAKTAFELSDKTPHEERKLPAALRRMLESRLAEWTEKKNNPAQIPTRESVEKQNQK